MSGDEANQRLPTGVVTFLFTDIEGSTRLVQELGERYGEVLADQRRILRAVWLKWGGVERGTEGDSFFVVFRSAHDAVSAAAEGQRRLGENEWPHGCPVRVRMGMHTGEPLIVDDDYFGVDVNVAARIAASSHGGQIVVSRTTFDQVRNALPAGITSCDLGEHRLKDLDDAVWIYQLGSERFPPLKSISNTNLPRVASSFVGRESEVSQVVSLLREGARLLTLTGPGGSGKTRLAIEAASELLHDFRNGVFWVGLAPLRDAAVVRDAIAGTLGAKDGLADHIGEREMLLVLDNFEQVIEAASWLSPLLAACPNLRLVVTSRELLRLQGEVEYPVPPLALAEAVQLFCARSGLEADETVVELCRRLDDLPLAVELAAARTRVLSPTQILARLSQRLDLLRGGRDVEERQSTLRATIEWSHELLSGHEKVLFSRLAVFAGGWTLASAEDICDADLDVLQALVDKSLIRHTEDRFSMLETIRDYAGERLESSGEAEEIRSRHAEHFLRLAMDAEEGLRGISKGSLERLEKDHDNLRAALERLQSSAETEKALLLAGSLSNFWRDRGYIAEGTRRLEHILGEAAPQTVARATALVGVGELAMHSGALETARNYVEEGLKLHRMLGDARGRAVATHVLGLVIANEADFGGAQQLFDASARLFGELGEEIPALWATRSLAWAYRELGDNEHARMLLEETLPRARATRNEALDALYSDTLAMIALDEGRVHEALPLMRAGLVFGREFGDLIETAASLGRVARGLSAASMPEPATRFLSASEGLIEEFSLGEPWIVKMNRTTLEMVRVQLADSAFSDAWEQGRRLTADEAVQLALGYLD